MVIAQDRPILHQRPRWTFLSSSGSSSPTSRSGRGPPTLPTLRTTRPCSRYHPSSQLKRKTFLSSCSGPANAALARGGSAPQPYLVPRPGPGHSIHCCCVRETPAVLRQVGGVSFKRKWSAPQANVPLMRNGRKESGSLLPSSTLCHLFLPPILCLLQMQRST